MTPDILILISTALYLVESKLMTTNRKAVRNADLDNINKTENQLWDARQCSRTCCISSCLRHIDCRSFAYDSNTERCQVFNRDFRGQNITENTVIGGIVHFDIVDVDCGMHGPSNNAPATDCADVQSQGFTSSGVYTLVVGGITKEVWCDLQTDGGGWTVIQQRKNGSVNFDVSWNEYKDGFGNPSHEYWIGNDALYSLTSGVTVELLILIERLNGVWMHARYSTFKVNDENDKYRLTVSGYTGTSGDSLEYHNGQQFSTRDQDNDGWPCCACNPVWESGGWWYKICAYADLNGRYHGSCYWYDTSYQWESLKTVFMMIRNY